MIGLDTNVLIRHIVQDHPVQSSRATELISRSLTPEQPGFISAAVLVEVAWVLERTYRVKRLALASVIERILQTEVFVVEHEQEAFEAMAALEEGLGSFADVLIGAIARKSGCSHTVTFDKQALRLAGFQPV